MQGKSYWFGREVEGRLTGVMTCFVREEIPKDEDMVEECLHIYFTVEYMRACTDYEDIAAFIEGGLLVTCEVDETIVQELCDFVRVRAHLIYRVKTPSLALLKNTDSVALDVAPYDVKITTLHHFQEVKPQDYTHDIERL